MIQEIINELEAKIEEQNQRDPATIINHTVRLGKISAYEHAITLIRSKLPEFEVSIKKAYEHGHSDGSPNSIKQDNGFDGDSQDYYNQNYKK